jgi:hypothetical protein
MAPADEQICDGTKGQLIYETMFYNKANICQGKFYSPQHLGIINHNYKTNFLRGKWRLSLLCIISMRAESLATIRMKKKRNGPRGYLNLGGLTKQSSILNAGWY